MHEIDTQEKTRLRAAEPKVTRYKPKRAFFEKDALYFPLGKSVKAQLEEMGVDIKVLKSRRVVGIPGETPQEKFREGKSTLVVGVKQSMELQTCKPSAHYQFPLVTNCPGRCQYCYLQTRFGKKPYLRMYVNIDEILQNVKKYIDKRGPDTTVFEVSASSDPVPTEYLSGSLAKTITFFADQQKGLLRCVTKSADIDSLLNLNHGERTRFRFSVNTRHIIDKFEGHTASFSSRLGAAGKMAKAGYPLGFIIGPIFEYEGWRGDYRNLVAKLAEQARLRELMPAGEAPDGKPYLTIELITHRYTDAAKRVILERFPHTDLDMDDDKRRFKFGQFGYGKWLYPKEKMKQMENVLTAAIEKHLPEAHIEYFV